MDLEFVDSVTRASSKSRDSMRRANARRCSYSEGFRLFPSWLAAISRVIAPESLRVDDDVMEGDRGNFFIIISLFERQSTAVRRLHKQSECL